MLVVEDSKISPEAERLIQSLRMDRCPDCQGYTLQPGPRGGAAQNLICTSCGARWNVAPPRYIMFAQRI
jgi:rRNA maturation protein Nop10